MWATFGTGFSIVVTLVVLALAMTGVLRTDRTAEYKAKTEMLSKQEQVIKKRIEERETDHRSYAHRAFDWAFKPR